MTALPGVQAQAIVELVDGRHSRVDGCPSAGSVVNRRDGIASLVDGRLHAEYRAGKSLASLASMVPA
jgi:hypothetical protein